MKSFCWHCARTSSLKIIRQLDLFSHSSGSRRAASAADVRGFGPERQRARQQSRYLALLVGCLPMLALGTDYQLVSRVEGTAPTSTVTTGPSFEAALSADGRLLAFSSEASNLVPNDFNGTTRDVFLHDRQTEETRILSPGGDGISRRPAISAGGRFVAFESRATNLDPNATGSSSGNLYLYDVLARSTTLITQAPDGPGLRPSISGDGRFIVFESEATELVALDLNGDVRDIFLFDRQTGDLKLITQGGQRDSSEPVISADGRFIAFASQADNLDAADTNGGVFDVFLYALATETIRNLTPVGNGPSVSPSISADGRFVAFRSRATNLGVPDSNGDTADIVLYDSENDSYSVVTAGADRPSSAPALSGDGRFVAFESIARNLIPGVSGTGRPDVYLFDVDAGVTALASPGGNDPSRAPGISGDGQVLAFESSADNLVPADANGANIDLFVLDQQNPGLTLVPQVPAYTVAGAGGNNSVISQNGRFVVFNGSAGNLGLAAPAGNLFRYDTVQDELLPLLPVVNRNAEQASISANGRYIAFEARVTNLVPLPFNAPQPNVYVVDAQSGGFTLVTAGANADSSAPVISADGRHVAFLSRADNLVPVDPNGVETDVFLRNLDTGATTLVTAGANARSEEVAVSGNGRFVAFSSRADNLVPEDTPATPRINIFLYDGQTGQTRMITAGANGSSSRPAISRNGRVVTFASSATNLVTSLPNGSSGGLFAYDRLTGSIERITPEGFGARLLRSSLSADGRFITFQSDAGDLVAGDVNGRLTDVFRFDRVTQSIVLVTTGTGGFDATISGDGASVAFSSSAINLANAGTDAVDVFVARVSPNPVAAGQFVSTLENESVTVALNPSDPDRLTLTYSITDGPASGQLTGTPPDLTYVPDAGFNGSDSFLFTAANGASVSARAQVNVFVEGVNDLPVVADQSLVIRRNTIDFIAHSALDADGDTLSFALDQPPTNGQVVEATGEFIYIPNQGYVGPDSFTFRVEDGFGGSTLATVSIEVVATVDELACGNPRIDGNVDAGLYLWKDCDDDDRWQLRFVSGNGTGPSMAGATIRAPGVLSDLEPFSLEAGDTLSLAGSDQITYALRVSGSGQDGFSFRIAPGFDPICYTPTEEAPDLFLGPARIPYARNGVDLRTFLSCDPTQDSDGDGLTDEVELGLGLDPNNPDTDGGGVADGLERLNRTNPTFAGDDLSVGCDVPVFDPAVDSGYYLHQDCSYSGPGRRYALTVTGGGVSFQRYAGALTADVPLAPEAVGLEGPDTFDTVADDAIVDFDFGVGGRGTDGFAVIVPEGASTCFDPWTAGQIVFMGARGPFFDRPFSFETLGPCSQPPPPVTGEQCGEPPLDPAREPGLYLWQECDAAAGDARWQGRVLGGGGPFRRYQGTITALPSGGGSAAAALAATGIDLEAADLLDSQPGDDLVDFDLRVVGSGSDGFELLIPAGVSACVDPLSVPAGGLFIGAAKVPQDGPFNTVDLSPCP